jgi:hypothetical protein
MIINKSHAWDGVPVLMGRNPSTDYHCGMAL